MATNAEYKQILLCTSRSLVAHAHGARVHYVAPQPPIHQVALTVFAWR